MILRALTGKAAPYILAAVGIVILGLLAAVGWLMDSRDKLQADNAKLSQAMEQAVITNADNLATIAGLERDIRWRDVKALERKERNQQMAIHLADTQAELQEAMQDAPECVNQPWPDTVFDIMRRDTVSDPDRVRTPAGAGGVPAADADTGARG